jgi:hypothetical protein
MKTITSSIKVQEYSIDHLDVKALIEEELLNPTFHLMDTDIYSLYRAEELGKRHFMTYEFYINSLSRKSLVELLERVREENTPLKKRQTSEIQNHSKL